MTRYFYTDPLAAAWMSKHFGMRFEEPLCIEGAAIGGNWDTYCDTSEGKAYIHPDGLHLLEPIVGDLLDFPRAIERYLICRENENDFTKLHHSFARYKVGQGEARIIQRNGVAFQWPEQEA